MGTGIDVVHVQRLKEKLIRTPSLGQRLFAPSEHDYALSRADPYMTLAKRFAAKEAFAKATGCGIGKTLAWTDIVVDHHATGQPYIRLSPDAYDAVMAHLNTAFAIHCSLSDDAMDTHAIAVACVIVQCVA